MISVLRRASGLFWATNYPSIDTTGSSTGVAKTCATYSTIIKVHKCWLVSHLCDLGFSITKRANPIYIGPEKDGVPASIYLDIRPALDSVEAGMDRVKMALKKMFGGGENSKQTQQ